MKTNLTRRLRRSRIGIHRSLTVESLESRKLLAAEPIITEFVSNNDGGLLDGNGVASDWIEIHNAGDTELELSGYHLTDDSENLTKWEFPEKTLASGEFLVVFASGNDELDPDGNLHTNFRLSQSGEYLALVEPDGTSIPSLFAPAYPAQRPGISYGIDQRVESTKLVDENSPARILIPGFRDFGIGSSWNGEAEPFDDSKWIEATASLGYDVTAAAEPENIAPTGTASQSSTDFNGSADNAIDGRFNNFTHTANEDSSWWKLEFRREKDIGRIVLWNRADCCAERLSNFRVSVFDVNDNEVYGEDFFTPDDGGGNPAAGEHLEIVLPPAVRGETIQVRFLGQNNQGNGWLSLSEVEVYESSGFSGLFNSDLLANMKDLNASLLVRIPFDSIQISESQSLKLNVRYDDGFVAYLNGQEIARRNAPESVTPLSSAPDDRSAEDAVSFETIDVSAHVEQLKDTGNLLTFHALNDRLDSDDFLLSAELAVVSTSLGDPRFFPTPTPNRFNEDGIEGFVEPLSFSAGRGFYDQPFESEITTPTPGATIIYTTDGSPPSLLNGTRVDSNHAELSMAKVPINTTTTLRAVAYKDGFEPTAIDTFTYLFLDDILSQPQEVEGFPSRWDGRSQNAIRADYEMDPDVVNDPAYSEDIRTAFDDIPSMSIVMDPDHLFGQDRGIYINSGQRGRPWEHPTSLEIIETDGSTFQVDTGIRIHGFSWRFHSNTPKHSFRLEFRDEYGPTRLDYPLFPDAPVDRFDSIVLRAQGGRAWAGLQEPQQAQYIRDVYARDTARDMGKIDGHAAYFHLYLNGLYWGLYHAVERPDAQMGEEYFGGSEEDYDALNRRTTTNEAIDGDLRIYNQMIALANDGVRTPDAYAEMQRFVDFENLIDFFLIHQFMTNRDGPETFQSNNQRAIGSRIDDPQFKFFVWDMEYSMWNVTDNINIEVDVPTSASRVYTALRENPEFRLAYADRVHKHMFNDGALTPEKAAERWMNRANEIRNAIVAESARWGDAKRGRPYTRDVEWQRELDRLMERYFPQRTEILLEQLREAGLYPNLDAPSFNQHGGDVASGFELTMSAPNGAVYYTLDGSDPRQPSESTGGGILVPKGSEWKYFDTGQDLGTNWKNPDFNDDNWSSGAAAIGYGYDDLQTIVNCGPGAPECQQDNIPTTYFRREFDVEDPSIVGELGINLRRDDGAVIYINGVEVARSNMPDGEIAFDTFARRSGNGRAFLQLKASSENLVAGKNVIAVELHNRSDTSDDIIFDLELSSTGTIGGEPSGAAIEYSGPVAIHDSLVVKSRAFHNGVWSALNEASFATGIPADRTNLRVTEVHYHPSDDAEAEFVELQNISDETINISGVRFKDAFEFDFSKSKVTSLKPGQRAVVVRDLDVFASTYDAENLLVAGQFEGRLSNGEDRVILLAADGSEIQNFTYSDEAPWPTTADGEGPSLEVIDLLGDYNSATNWRASSTSGGTPGRGAEIPGDSNRDGIFNSSDLVQVFQAGEYEDKIVGNSTWEEGDWNDDGDFTSGDLVFAFQAGAYQAQARPIDLLRLGAAIAQQEFHPTDDMFDDQKSLKGPRGDA